MNGVDWLIEVLNNIKPDEFCSIEKVKELCHQAKEMEEKERMYSEVDMKLAFEIGRNFQLTGDNNFKELIESFKKNKQ